MHARKQVCGDEFAIVVAAVANSQQQHDRFDGQHDRNGGIPNLLRSFCCIFEKDTLRFWQAQPYLYITKYKIKK